MLASRHGDGGGIDVRARLIMPASGGGFVAALLDLLIIWVASFAVGVFFDPFGIGAF